MLYEIVKRYDNIPFAHRQHAHDGHCAMIHGHDWAFEFCFTTTTLDACGFVLDFGKLKWIKEQLEAWDHALLLAADDPLLEDFFYFAESYDPPLANIVVLESVSCEGIAEYLARHFASRVHAMTEGRVSLCWVMVQEGAYNRAKAFANTIIEDPAINDD